MAKNTGQNNLQIEVNWRAEGEPSAAWDKIWQKLLTSPKQPSKIDLPDVEYQGDHSGRLN
jgi:hypothetical protein